MILYYMQASNTENNLEILVTPAQAKTLEQEVQETLSWLDALHLDSNALDLPLRDEHGSHSPSQAASCICSGMTDEQALTLLDQDDGEPPLFSAAQA